MKNITTKAGFIILLMLGSLATTNAQLFDWAKNMGGDGTDDGYGIATDGSGNVFVTGGYAASTIPIKFNPGGSGGTLNNSGNGDVFLAKYDATGKFLWAKGAGGSNGEAGKSVAVDGNGNALITGFFNSDSIDFNPGGSGGLIENLAGTFFGTLRGNNSFLVKYDGIGNFIWAKQLGGNGTNDRSNSVAVDSKGNVFVTGQFNSPTIDFDPGGSNGKVNRIGGNDVFLVKYDATGKFLWAKGVGGSGGDIGYGVAADGDGNVFVTGQFASSSIDFNSGGGSGGTISTAGGTDAFLAKYDGDGKFLWAKDIRAAQAMAGLGIAVDGSGNAYLTGSFSGTGDFDPGSGSGTSQVTSNGAGDIFMAKYDATGKLVWVKGMGSNNANYDDAGQGITVDHTGRIVITGYFLNTVDFDPGPDVANLTSTPNGYWDIFIAKYDNDGKYLWAKGMGGNGNDDGGKGVATSASGDIYGTGYYTDGPVIFDTSSAGTLTGYGVQDIYLVKLSDTTGCANGSSFSAKACNSYDFNGKILTASGTYLDTFTNAGGCDSVVTLKLTINKSTSNTVSIKACNSYDFDGKTFTASGTYQGTFTNAAGCDSVVTLKLTINKSTSSTVSIKACNSYDFNGKTFTASGTYQGTFTNAAGCDSVVTLKLTVNKSTSSNVSVTACDNYSFNGTKLTTSGTYKDTLSNAAGCDSIVTLNLTVNHSSDTTLAVQACDTFTLNDSVYTVSGTYTQTLSNSSGCDSTITLQLTLGSSPQATVTQTNDSTLTAGSAASYQWLDCDNDYAPIDGATAQTFTPDHTGNYAVAVITGACSDTSDCYKVEITNGINELAEAHKIKLYPNPTTGRVMIKTEQTLQDATIRLVNIMGQVLVERTQQNGKQFELDMAPYAGGIYFVEIGQGRKMVRMKLVKD